MIITYVNAFRGHFLGGGEEHLLLLIKEARSRGHKVYCCVQAGSVLAAAVEAAGAIVFPCALSPRSFLTAYRQIKTHLQNDRPQIVHTHGFFGDQLGRFSAHVAGITNIVSTVHCQPRAVLARGRGIRPRLEFSLRRIIDNHTSRYTSVLIAVSVNIGDELIAQGIPKQKIKVIHNGIELRNANSEKPADQKLKKSRIVVGSVGRFESEKNFGLLIRLAGYLSAHTTANGPEVLIRIAGDGPGRELLSAEAAKLGLGRIVELPGYLDDLDQFICSLDVFVLPSLTEGLNLSLIRALGHGVPAVAFRVGGNDEIILHGETGLLAEGGDEKALFDAVLKLVQDQDLRAQMTERSTARFKQEFKSQKMLDKLFGLYEDLVDMS